MYYLLEDNRIIDENNMYLKKFRQLKDSGDPDFVNADEKETLEKFFGKIKLQGENVFDLIEFGDLVKVVWLYGLSEFTNKEYGTIYVNKDLKVSNENILAIYKPDKHGNYIKVWKRGIENG